MYGSPRRRRGSDVYAPRYERHVDTVPLEVRRGNGDPPTCHVRHVGAGRRRRVAIETGGGPDSSSARHDHYPRPPLADFYGALSPYKEPPLRDEERRRLDEERRIRDERRAKEGYGVPEARMGRPASRRRYHSPPSPWYRPASPAYAPTSPAYAPTSPHDKPFGVPAADEAEELRPVSSGHASSGRLYGSPFANEGHDFKLPAKPQAATYSYVEEVAFPLNADAEESSGKPSQPLRSKFNGPITEVPIAQSRWLGSAYDRGDLSADISTTGSRSRDAAATEKTADPLMRWHHLERSTMNFEELIAAAGSVLQVSEQKRRDVNRLLRDVQRKFEKQRQHGRDLEPNCVSDLFVGDSSKGDACIIFLSFPYFCLEPYNQAAMKNLTPGTPLHPLRPLLQSHFHSTSQKRELAQAITKSPNTGDSNCLHLSQMWCLILDDDTILTCSRQSHDTLCDPEITKSEASTADRSGGAHIKVSFGNDRSWHVPVNDELSWPAFLSVFGDSIATLEDDGRAADVRFNGESVGAHQWSFLVGAAETGSVGLDLHQTVLQPGGAAQLAAADASVARMANMTARTDGPDSIAEMPTPSREGDTAYTNQDIFQIEEEASPAIFKHTTDATLEMLAENLAGVLESNERERERRAYIRTSTAKPFAALNWLQTAPTSSQTSRRDLARAAIYLFRFFWPLAFRSPLTDRYWGTVQQLLQQDDQAYTAANVDAAIADLTNNIIPSMESLVREFEASPADLSPLPDAYSKAFLHLIMVFVLLSQTSERRGFGVNNSTVRAHLRGIKDDLSAGKRQITARLQTESQTPALEELEICSHTSLLALVLNQFSQDVMHGRPDVASTYTDYFAQLDFRITEDPAPRAHQESLRFFLQEVEAILSTLEYQRSVLEAFEQSLLQQRTAGGDGGDNYLLRYALGESRQEVVLASCKSRVASRIDKFRGLQQRAEDLGEWHRNAMETNRDRQENAIMVFTIVTIVFLPLSFVSSVFGMNTSDVRDMPYSQWAYWAASVPLTILVVVGSLWWAGAFEGFGGWVQRTLTRASTASGGYHRIPEPASYGGRRQERVEVAARKSSLFGGSPPPPEAPVKTVYPRRRRHR